MLRNSSTKSAFKTSLPSPPATKTTTADTVTLTTKDNQVFTVEMEIAKLFGIKIEPKSQKFYQSYTFFDDFDSGDKIFDSAAAEEDAEESSTPSLPNVTGPAFEIALSWAKHHLRKPKKFKATTAFRVVDYRDPNLQTTTAFCYLQNRLFAVDLWDVQFVSALSGEQLQLLLEAANYLNMGWLLDSECKVAVKKMANGGRDFVYSAEEEANLLKVARECSFDVRRTNNNNKCMKVAENVDVKGKSIISTGNLAASFINLKMPALVSIKGGSEVAVQESTAQSNITPQTAAVIVTTTALTSSSSDTIIDVLATVPTVSQSSAIFVNTSF